jgi:glutamate:GABA antiporter
MKRESISTLALVLLISGAIDSLRNLPATALFGSSLLFFLVFAAIVFLIPVALVSAQLGSYQMENTGVYGWVKAAFGEKIGFLAIWLQWINTMVWYPTILSFIAGTLAYLINPQLAHSKIYLVSVILITFWLLTLLNLRGLTFSTKFTTICATVGLIVPVTFVIVFAIIWVFQGKPLQIHLSASHLLPSFHGAQSWVSLTAIMTAFLGMELASVHAKSVKNPQKVFPKALMISVVFILITMAGGALAIALVLPKSQIELVDGLMQVFRSFFVAYHVKWLTPVLAVLILLGSAGGMINWIISPAKGLLQAGNTGYLPKFITKENKHGVASRLLIAQAILVSFVSLAFLLMPGVNGSYWLLTDLSTQVYMFMYLLLFFASLVLFARFGKVAEGKGFSIPGGKWGTWLVTVLGLIGCVITMIVGFFPPASIDVGGIAHYEMLFVGGMIVMVLPVFGFFFYKHVHLAKN